MFFFHLLFQLLQNYKENYIKRKEKVVFPSEEI